MKYAALICLLFLTAGCDIFRTRDPQIPDQPRSNFQQAVTHDIPIQNLIHSLEDLNANQQNYLDCFVDSQYANKNFIFVPTSSAASLYPAFSTWDKKSESRYYTNLKSGLLPDLQMTVNIIITDSSQQEGSWIYSAAYSLDIPFKDASLPTHYEGDLKFYMIQDSRSIWSIYQWQDIKTTNSLSWSDLKGRLY